MVRVVADGGEPGLAGSDSKLKGFWKMDFVGFEGVVFILLGCDKIKALVKKY